VLLHGTGATYYEDINAIQSYLNSQGYCTYSLTYGIYVGFPYAGGFPHVSQTAPQIAAFIQKVYKLTGSKNRVDLVGHSLGGLQSLYVPKFEGVSNIVDKIIAIAPPTHGTTADGAYNGSAILLGDPATAGTILASFGCAACQDQLPDGPAVQMLNTGPIVQSGNRITVIASNTDEGVTPAPKASFINEAGVMNWSVQDFCPTDHVGHVGEPYDMNVINLVVNALDQTPDRKFTCIYSGSPN